MAIKRKLAISCYVVLLSALALRTAIAATAATAEIIDPV
jgi:hypothetical protein